MGALTAFLTGVGGTGLMNVLQDRSRREETAARLQLERERMEADAENRRLDRESRESMLMDRLAAGQGALASASRGGARGGAADPAAEREMAINRLAAEHGMSRPEAIAAIDSYERGENPYTREEAVPEQIDDGDGRTRTVTTTKQAPDVAKFRAMMASVAKHFSQAGGYVGADADKQAAAERTRIGTDLATRAPTDPNAARGALYLGGKGEFGDTGTSAVTGKAAAGSVAESQITENRAQANSANAAAGKYSAEAKKAIAEAGGDLKSQSAEKLTTTLNSIVGLIRTYDENSMDDAAKQARQELQATARAIAAELQRRGLPAQTGGAPKADKPAPAPAPAASAPAADKFTVGKVYKDAKGNRAKYLGNGKWEPA